MNVIRVREQPGGLGSSNATVSFDYGPEYPSTLHNPFSEPEEKLLEWYFERYVSFPFNKERDAQRAAKSITDYGERLFKQIFADPGAFISYRQCIQAGLNTLQLEIAGSPEFHRLHWEALKDPQLPQPLALHAPVVRKNLVPQVLSAAVRPSPTINLLLVTARPFGASDQAYRTISNPLVELLRQANLRVQIEILRPGTYQALDQHLREVSAHHGVGYYHVLHFDAHGATLPYDQLQKEMKESRYQWQKRYGRAHIQPYEGFKAFLFMESEQDNTADPVEATELANLLLSHQVPITILNACQSGKQVGTSETSLGSRLIQLGVQLVLATGYTFNVTAAELLMRTLYSKLFAGYELSMAICSARQELYNRKERRAVFNYPIELEDWLLPVVYQNSTQRLTLREFTPEEAAAYYGRLATGYKARQPNYGVVGRDLDILKIEKRLLIKRNLLLMRGKEGVGKTALLQHLGSWWQTTGFVQQVFYFDYNDKTWTRQQILTTNARRLLSNVEYVRDFQPLGLEAQQAMLTRCLRAEHHLLILDNLESITGAHHAIKHTLSAKEQKALHSFLVDLAGGRTLVVLSSRSDEKWLAQGTFGDNIYELGGLDPEAAATLADCILEQHGATVYRQDANLQKLLMHLEGLPLALETELAKLAHQKPAEVLSDLQGISP